jgi:hypothetical protein
LLSKVLNFFYNNNFIPYVVTEFFSIYLIVIISFIFLSLTVYKFSICYFDLNLLRVLQLDYFPNNHMFSSFNLPTEFFINSLPEGSAVPTIVVRPPSEDIDNRDAIQVDPPITEQPGTSTAGGRRIVSFSPDVESGSHNPPRRIHHFVNLPPNFTNFTCKDFFCGV